MEYVKLKNIAKYPTGKLDSNAAVEGGKYPFFTCAQTAAAIDTYAYDGEYVLLGGNNANGNFPVFYYNGKFNAYQRTYLIQPTFDNIDTKYLYYAIQLKLNQMRSNAAGTATKFLTKPILNNINIEYRSLDEQRYISSILSTYDDLIENNNRRISLLEQMAENLYKEWFVRFRFPGFQQFSCIKTNIGNIPVGFSVVKMKDVFDYYIGGGWGNDEKSTKYPVEAYVIRGTDFTSVKTGNIMTCPRRYHKVSNFKPRKLEEGDIILEVSGGTAMQPVGRTVIITEGIIKKFENEVICASFCKLLRLKRDVVSPYFFIYWMNYLYETKIIDRYQLQSTGIINFKFDHFLRKCDLLIPPLPLMKAFEDKIKLIKHQIDVLSDANANLTKQRDMLLPRLMSGKLEV